MAHILRDVCRVGCTTPRVQRPKGGNMNSVLILRKPWEAGQWREERPGVCLLKSGEMLRETRYGYAVLVSVEIGGKA